jgi:hypothetical protein
MVEISQAMEHKLYQEVSLELKKLNRARNLLAPDH